MILAGAGNAIPSDQTLVFIMKRVLTKCLLKLSCLQQGSRHEAALLGSRTMAGLASRLALGVAFAAACAAVSTADGTPGETDWPSTNYDQASC